MCIRDSKDTIFAYALYYPAVELLSAIAIALVIWRGGFGVLSGSVTIGVLAMFNMYSQRFWRPIQDLSDKYNILQAAMAACERIFKLLDTEPEIVSPANPLEGDGSNRIEFRHVWFTYQKLKMCIRDSSHPAPPGVPAAAARAHVAKACSARTNHPSSSKESRPFPGSCRSPQEHNAGESAKLGYIS